MFEFDTHDIARLLCKQASVSPSLMGIGSSWEACEKHRHLGPTPQILGGCVWDRD